MSLGSRRGKIKWEQKQGGKEKCPLIASCILVNVFVIKPSWKERGLHGQAPQHRIASLGAAWNLVYELGYSTRADFKMRPCVQRIVAPVLFNSVVFIFW